MSGAQGVSTVTGQRIKKVLDSAFVLVDLGADDFAAASDSLVGQTTAVYRQLAVATVVDAIRRRRRQQTAAAEEAAQRAREQEIQAFNESPEARERNARFEAQWKQRELEREQEELERVRRHGEEMRELVERFRESIIMEWTAEVLGSAFTLEDGTKVTWGEASIEQHERREAMFTRNAVKNAEGAARHRQAIIDLRAAGVARLADLVSEVRQEDAGQQAAIIEQSA